MDHYHTVITHHNDGYVSIVPNVTVLPPVYENTMIYNQPGIIDVPHVHYEYGFPYEQFVHTHDLMPVTHVDHIDRVVHYDTFSKEIPYFKRDTSLSKEQRKSCRCYLHLQEKNRSGNHYNPYAVCNRNLPAVRSCSDDYDFEDFTDSELRGYIRAHKIKTHSLDREDMLDAIYNK